MSKIQDRIRQYIDTKNISIREFCRQINVSPSFLSRDAEISSDKMLNIVNAYPEISLDWLIIGKGDMLRKKSPPLLPEDQETLREICESIRKENMRLKEKIEEKDKQLGELIKTNLLLLEREKEDCDSPQEKKKRCSSAG